MGKTRMSPKKQETKRRYKRYPREFKEEVCRLAQQNMMSRKELGEKFDIDPNLISKWLTNLRYDGKEAFRGRGNRKELEREVDRLRDQVKELEQEKEILKKASAYFAKHLV
jgi:transposase